MNHHQYNEILHLVETLIDILEEYDYEEQLLLTYNLRDSIAELEHQINEDE